MSLQYILMEDGGQSVKAASLTMQILKLGNQELEGFSHF